MNEELYRLENILLKENGLKISMPIEDSECEEYFGYNFQLDHYNIKFRKAKVTPKKNGQFVTLWRRNTNKQTEPFHYNDSFDFYIIAAEYHEKSGYFIFQKSLLAEKQILTSDSREGKRGFRVYPAWDIPQNKQAERTQKWQLEYFIDTTLSGNLITEKLNIIFKIS